MRKILTIGIVLATSLFCSAQKVDTVKNSVQKKAEAIGHGGNNELKINLLFTVLGIPEISYERLLADNMGVGASIFVGVDNSLDLEYKFAFTPYYRLYFGAKKASGFFIEGNATVISINEDYYIPSSSFAMYPGNYVIKNRTSFGLGAAAGGKFLTRNGFLGEAYLGLGRLLGDRRDYSEAYPRFGITIGKRF